MWSVVVEMWTTIATIVLDCTVWEIVVAIRDNAGVIGLETLTCSPYVCRATLQALFSIS